MASTMTRVDMNALFAISLPLLIIGGITAVTWFFVGRRHRREREQGTYRPLLILRIAGLVITVLGAIFLAVGMTQITAALLAGSPITDDYVAQAVIGAVLTVAGLFVWLKNSTRLTLGAEGLSYSKYLFVRGSMHYRELASVRATQSTRVWTITLRDIHGITLDMPEAAADWSRLIDWAMANYRPDISDVLLESPHDRIPTL